MIKIRSASAADSPAMIKLGQEAATAAHWSREQYEQIFAAGAQKRVALVGESGSGEIQGFVVARAVSPEWEIENIVVAGHVQRQAVGTQLVDALLAQARYSGAEAVLLEVRESNHPARGLYRKLGFSETGQRRRYYRNPEENAVMYRVDFT